MQSFILTANTAAKANYTLRNGTERNGTTLGVHDRVEIKLLLTIKKDFIKISSFSHIM